MRVNFPGYDGALPEQWPDCHCILWPFLGEDRWLQAWIKAGLGTKLNRYSGESAEVTCGTGFCNCREGGSPSGPRQPMRVAYSKFKQIRRASCRGRGEISVVGGS